MKMILSDFDGTITIDEKISEEFLELVSLCNRNNSPLVIVSGRPASWGSFLMNYFNIHACIMEDGGFMLTRDRDNSKKVLRTCLLNIEERTTLVEIKNWITINLPQAIPSDDFEDRGASCSYSLINLSLSDFIKIETFLFTKGFRAYKTFKNLYILPKKIDKLFGIQYFLKLEQISSAEIVYFGDSINDESAFNGLPYTVGVSNIEHYLDLLEHKPNIILTGKENRSVKGILNFLRTQAFQSQ